MEVYVMKKITDFIILCMILSAVTLCSSADGIKVGDKLGDVLYTDIVMYIDGYPIRSYNIAGNTYIVAEDLVDYGFDVVWDGTARTLTIETQRTVLPENYTARYVPEKSSGKIGEPIMPYVYSDIRVYIGDNEIESYSIDGFMCINTNHFMGVFASHTEWSNEKRTLSMISDPWAFGLCSLDGTGHEWEEENYVHTPATAISKGIEFRRCANCNQSEQITTESFGRIHCNHKYDENNISVRYSREYENGYAYFLSLDKPGDIRVVEEYRGLKPDTYYIVEADIMTENVEDTENPDAPYGATVSVGNYVNTAALTGDNKWTTKRIYAKTDSNGSLDVSLCLGYWYHDSVGSACFKNIKLTELNEFEVKDPTWKFLWVVADTFKVDYYDSEMKRTVKVSTDLREKQIEKIRKTADEFEKMLAKASGGRMVPKVELLVIDIELDELAAYAEEYYWVSPNLTYDILYEHGCDIGNYDNVTLIADSGDMPVNGYWGLGGNPIYRYIGYSFIRYLSGGENEYGIEYALMWHEYLHTAEYRAMYYMGFEIPKLHDKETYENYVGSENYDKWYTDYMNCAVKGSKHEYRGIPPFIWELKPSLFT